MNFKLYNTCGKPNIIARIKSHRIRWIDHVTRMLQTSSTKEKMDSNPDNNRLRKYQRRGELTMSLRSYKKIKVKNWEAEALDWEVWK